MAQLYLILKYFVKIKIRFNKQTLTDSTLFISLCNIKTIVISLMAAFVHFSRCPNVPLIQGPGEKGRTSGPEPRVSRLMSRSVSCTMKVPKGDLVTYASNGQVR